ncbi:MAG: hypothetical protein V7637_6081 [Mycobacteriales bacterium]|jgi:hypothetical protein
MAAPISASRRCRRHDRKKCGVNSFRGPRRYTGVRWAAAGRVVARTLADQGGPAVAGPEEDSCDVEE